MKSSFGFWSPPSCCCPSPRPWDRSSFAAILLSNFHMAKEAGSNFMTMGLSLTWSGLGASLGLLCSYHSRTRALAQAGLFPKETEFSGHFQKLGVERNHQTKVLLLVGKHFSTLLLLGCLTRHETDRAARGRKGVVLCPIPLVLTERRNTRVWGTGETHPPHTQTGLPKPTSLRNCQKSAFAVAKADW